MKKLDFKRTCEGVSRRLIRSVGMVCGRVCCLPGCPSPILSEFLDEDEEGGADPLEGLLLLLRLEEDVFKCTRVCERVGFSVGVGV